MPSVKLKTKETRKRLTIDIHQQGNKEIGEKGVQSLSQLLLKNSHLTELHLDVSRQE